MHKMNSRRVSFLFFAVAITVVAAQSASVSIWNTDVTLTCPGDDEVEWHKGKERYHTDKDLILKDYTDKNEGLYYCSYKTGEDDNKVKITQYFYIKAKVCDGCVDMNMTTAFGVVFADVLITLGIVVMVYLCAKKRAGATAPQRPTQARQPRGQTRGPPTPDPDYQPLNPATRANDVYAQAQPQPHRR